MPSQKQLQWSQLRVGLTVIIASIALIFLIFLMSGTTGWFSHKVLLKSYMDNAAGLRVGAPVRLHGVDIGNVESVRVISGNPLTPVEIVMRVNTRYAFDLRQDSATSLTTAGVLGETFVDIDSSQAKGPVARDGDVLPIRDRPDFQDLVRSGQSTLQNMQALLNRVDRILSVVESGKGSVGKLINDPSLYDRFNATISDFQGIISKVGHGEGSLGKLITDEELYRKTVSTVDRLNSIVDEVNQGKGTAGKLLKDPALYDNANQTLGEARKLMQDVNAGKGALGRFAHDEEFARKLDNTMTKLSALADRLEAGEGTAGKLFHDPALYDNADKMLVETRELIKAVRQNPKKYLTIHLKIF